MVTNPEDRWDDGVVCFGYRVAELLGDPGIGGAPGDGKVDHTARSEFDDDKDEHGAEESIVGLHEIASPDLACVVAQERGPGLLGRERPTDIPQVALNGALCDLNPQLLQLPANALCAPGVVLSGHALDQRDDVVAERRSARLAL